MASDSFQYRALFEYKRERGDDISLQPGDLLTVPKASLMAVAGLDYQDGDERSPKGWLHGTNERTKEKGDFPGTFVEYVGVVRVSPPATKSWTRPVPPTPGGAQTAVGASGAAAASGVEAELLSEAAPVVVWRLIEAIEKHGFNNESLYRAPPASSGPAELHQAVDSDPFSVDLDQYDEVSLTDALRGFLQDLPAPIIPATVYSELVYTAQESQSVEECGERLKRILESPSIPQANHQLLVHLSRHLARVSQHSQASPRLLGQAFAEAVFKHSPLSADVNPEHHIRMLEALITTGGLMEMQAAPVQREDYGACADRLGQFMSG
ncbi:phosphatidylinositol 3-kinase regulatory subunit alpha-like [Plectropomus leopardus]|uniref:phosphatidylinositol 3-kinase regulatory subunit alpha-like n=1 Tax=Plectropomus leopardus TaxID=160734 RepID=UPI001C4D816F|nr:phosphatidylinositol 3-kinase regulatory subunit alpha-like [Plectropomus leopardus]